MINVEYVVSDTGVEYPQDALSLGLRRPLSNPFDDWDVEILAREAAEQYWSDHDGWESHWPLEFEIFIDGKSAGKCSVSMEMEPVFSANIKAVQHD